MGARGSRLRPPASAHARQPRRLLSSRVACTATTNQLPHRASHVPRTCAPQASFCGGRSSFSATHPLSQQLHGCCPDLVVCRLTGALRVVWVGPLPASHICMGALLLRASLLLGRCGGGGGPGILERGATLRSWVVEEVRLFPVCSCRPRARAPAEWGCHPILPLHRSQVRGPRGHFWPDVPPPPAPPPPPWLNSSLPPPPGPCEEKRRPRGGVDV